MWKDSLGKRIFLKNVIKNKRTSKALFEQLDLLLKEFGGTIREHGKEDFYKTQLG